MAFLDQNQIWVFLASIQGHRNESLYHVAIHTGMRQGELLGLMWSDLNWNNKTLHIQRQAKRVKSDGIVFKPTKTKSGNRTIHIGEEIIIVLRQHSKKQNVERQIAGKRWVEKDLIFPKTIGTFQCGSTILREFKELLTEAGLNKIKFHGLRHTAAYLLLNNGVDLMKVSRRLGHSLPSTTLNHYGHMIPSHQDEGASLMDDLMTPMHMEIPVKQEQNL